MTDDSKPVSAESKGKGIVETIKSKGKKNKGNNKAQGGQVNFLKQPIINDKNVVVKSSE
jgi:hypothetical protein